MSNRNSTGLVRLHHLLSSCRDGEMIPAIVVDDVSGVNVGYKVHPPQMVVATGAFWNFGQTFLTQIPIVQRVLHTIDFKKLLEKAPLFIGDVVRHLIAVSLHNQRKFGRPQGMTTTHNSFQVPIIGAIVVNVLINPRPQSGLRGLDPVTPKYSRWMWKWTEGCAHRPELSVERPTKVDNIVNKEPHMADVVKPGVEWVIVHSDDMFRISTHEDLHMEQVSQGYTCTGQLLHYIGYIPVIVRGGELQRVPEASAQ